MSKIGDEVEKAMEDLASDLEEEYYGVGDNITTTTSTEIVGIDSVSTSGTSIDTTTNPYWGTTSNDVVFSGSGGFENQAVISIGPLQISATEDGEVEMVLETDEFREEYHFSAKTMRGLLRKLADVVVEGKET